MTPQEILEYVLQLVVVVLVPAIGYVFAQQRAARRKLFERYDSIREDFTAAQIEAAKEYMSKSEIRQLIETAIEPIKASLSRIERNQDKILNGR